MQHPARNYKRHVLAKDIHGMFMFFEGRISISSNIDQTLIETNANKFFALFSTCPREREKNHPRVPDADMKNLPAEDDRIKCILLKQASARQNLLLFGRFIADLYQAGMLPIGEMLRVYGLNEPEFARTLPAKYDFLEANRVLTKIKKCPVAFCYQV